MLQWVLLRTVAAVHCADSCASAWVRSRQRGDGVCDWECNAAFCGFDIGAAGQWDCEKDCLQSGCQLDLLGNGVCDSQCQSAACGYDKGDCGYCAYSCPLHFLNDAICQAECNVQICGFDKGSCGECAPGCSLGELLGNGVCDTACNVPACFFDAGDCGTCAEGCLLSQLGDKVCQPACMTELCGFDYCDCRQTTDSNRCALSAIGNGACDDLCYTSSALWDGGDCDCAPGCSHALNSDSKCDLACASSVCLWDQGNCVTSTQGACAFQCTEEMLGDGVCHAECNTASCLFDNGDCECSADCSLFDVFECKAACLVYSCNYGILGDSLGCSDEMLLSLTLATQAITGDFNAQFDMEKCTLSDPQCVEGFLLATLSLQACLGDTFPLPCNTKDCAYAFGYCNPALDVSCLRGFGKSASECLECKIGYVRLFSTCLYSCPRRYYTRSDQPTICVPREDTSSEASPDVIYVADSKVEGNGSLAEPFNTVGLAITAAWQSYTNMYLLGPSVVLTLNTTSSHPEVMTINIVGNKKPFKLLRIASLTCADFWSERCSYGYTKISIIQPLPFSVNYNVIIERVILSSARLFSGLSTSICPNLIYEDDVWLQDTGLPAPEDYIKAASLCAPFSDYSVIVVLKGGVVLIRNADIVNLGLQPLALLNIQGGDVVFENVNFENVHTLRNRYAAGIILQDRKCSDLVCGSLTYINGTVRYMNNGLRYVEGLLLSPFLYGAYLSNIMLANVTFEHNFVVDAYASTEKLSSAGLIYLDTFHNLTITNCNFTNNFVTGGLLVVSSTVVLPKLSDSQNNAYLYMHAGIRLNDLRFEGNLGECSLVTIRFQRDVLNVYMSALVLGNNAVEGYSLIAIQSDREAAMSLAVGEIRSVISATTGKKENLWFAPRLVQLIDVEIAATFSAATHILIENLANVNITHLTISNSGDMDESVLNNTYFLYQSDPAIVSNDPPLFPDPSACFSFLYLNANINSALQFLSITANLCNSGICGVNFPKSAGTLAVADFLTRDNACNSQSGTALTVSEDAVISIGRLTAINNTNLVGGVLSFGARSVVTLSDLLLERNRGVLGGVIAGVAVQSLTVQRTTVRQNSATGSSGGGIYLVAGNSRPAYFLFTDCLFEGNSADKGGALAIQSSNLTTISLRIRSSQFKTNQVSGFGAALAIDVGLDLQSDSLISGCWFGGQSAGSGTVALSQKSGLLRFQDCDFEGNSGQNAAGIYIETEETAHTIFENIRFTHNLLGVTVLKANSRFNSTFLTRTCSFSNNSNSDIVLEGGFWQDFNSTFLTSNVTEFLLSARALAALTQTTIRESKALYQGGGVHLLSGAVLLCDGCVFLNNSAGHSGGAVYAEQDSRVILRNSVLRYNSAGQNGAALQLISSVHTISIIDSTLIELNLVGNLGVIFVQSSSLVMSNVTFRSNLGSQCPGVVLVMSTFHLQNSLFYGQIGHLAAFLSALMSSTLLISGSAFREGSTENGGNIAVASSTMNMTDSALESLQGGAIFVNGDCQVTLERVSMLNVYLETEGSLVDALYSQLIIIDCHFSNYRDIGLFGFQMSAVTILGSSFTSGTGKSGAAFQCYQCSTVLIERSAFMDQSAETAGAVWLWAQDPGFEGFLVVSETRFEGNSATSGGAVGLRNYHANITGSVFVGNRAEEGAGLWLGCDVVQMCSYAVSNSTFVNNSAAVKGGGILWTGQKPELTDLTYSNNYAIYGADKASYPIRLMLDAEKARMLSNFTITNYPPGQTGPNPLRASLRDHYGQIYTIDNSSVAVLDSADSSASILGVSKVTATHGTFLFDDFRIYTRPGGEINVTITSSAITTEQAGDPDAHSPTVQLLVIMRECVPGEAETSLSCDVCGTGTYSFDPLTPCQTCLAHAQCWGNFTVTPEAGYWRSGNFSPVIWPCLNSESCLGGYIVGQALSLTGYCSTGYEGNLCQPCQDGYSRSGKTACGKCLDNDVNTVRLVFLTIALIIVLAFMVSSTLRASTRPKAEYSILIKIMANYVQIVTLVLGFKLKWPQSVLSLFTVQVSMGGASEQFFSVDCLIAANTGPQDVYYRKMVMMALIPVLLVAVSVLFWTVVSWRKRKWVLMGREGVATIIIIFFLILPTLVDSMFSLFSCMEIDTGAFWLLADLKTKCWDATHSAYMLTVGLPGLIVWVFAVPLLCVGVLTKYRRRLDEIWLKLQYGFLISGYRWKCYYWEFVILYRKVLIIMCGVFISSSIPMQALTIQLVLLSSLLLQLYVRPFTSYHLNMTETLAICVSDATIYCGLYYLTEELSSETSLLFFAVIVVTNAVFLCYWLYALVDSTMDAINSSFPALGYLLRPHYFRDKEIERLIEENIKANSLEVAAFTLNLSECMRKMLGNRFPSFKSPLDMRYAPRASVVSDSRTLIDRNALQKASAQLDTDRP